jgi:hypothetical protein
MRGVRPVGTDRDAGQYYRYQDDRGTREGDQRGRRGVQAGQVAVRQALRCDEGSPEVLGQ